MGKLRQWYNKKTNMPTTFSLEDLFEGGNERAKKYPILYLIFEGGPIHVRRMYHQFNSFWFHVNQKYSKKV